MRAENEAPAGGGGDGRRRVVILGNGVAGITAARTLRQLGDDRILVISGETDHFFSRTALMYIFMGHMGYEQTKPYADGFWAENDIELRRAWVERIDTARRRLVLEGGEEVPYDALLLATGSAPNRAGWPGQDLPGVQSLYSYQDLELLEENAAALGAPTESKAAGLRSAKPPLPHSRAVIVGGGLIGIELCEMLHTRGLPVTFLVRESSWMERSFPVEEGRLIEAEIRRHGIDLRLGAELERIEAGDDGRVAAVVTGGGETIPCGLVGLTIGVHPNIALLEGTGIECDRGILVDETLATSVPGVWAAGDCVQLRRAPEGRRPIEPVWYTARTQGQFAARAIAGEPLDYAPGIWFNSAKFFDLEWQIYGSVPARGEEGHDSLYWQAADGQAAIRLHYRTADLAVRGFQVLGVRYRHEMCDQWLREEAPMPRVLRHLGAANFDPELYAEHEEALVARWNELHPEERVELETRRGLAGFLSRLRRKAS